MKYWKLKGLGSFAIFFYLSSYLPLLTDPFLESYKLFDLTGLGTIGGALFAIGLDELGVYGLHRWMHHSAERMDTYGAFFFSPLDMIGFTVLGSICTALLVGITPQAIPIMLLTTTFLSIFQHANVHTPRWIGCIIQRPESHTIHHAKGIHQYNYSDLPIFDIFFGTFQNPKGYANETGFYEGASERIGEMLIFKDVSVEEPQRLRKAS